jgi:A/G-specific adenine glycosylase
MPAYTQAIMDLGATVCTPRRVRCEVCPLRAGCVAHVHGMQEVLPRLTRKLKRSAEAWRLLVAQAPDGRVWLTRRPAKGIWAGLHAWPMRVAEEAEVREGGECLAFAQAEVGAAFKHVLTHKDLYLTPVQLLFDDQAAAERWAAGQPEEGQWWTAEEAQALGLPKPVRDVLEDLLAPRLI